ncbi:hypothetical protein SAMN05444166_2347 [Singulisphaera sp. GP187]|uniref:hypothetical protein n=1 Tax=Singulisphaera sp. GP187 TaxID=1882752 RepID=UPI0009266F0B|nr:hypothetical protein [Singulisphaera sp. GP187]SIO08041.1 hypothetical protein SAMN05444166_2347 [Singulisphaera sp. GP187]
MFGLKTSLAAFALLGAIGTSAQAQGVVPGGWSAQFGYQPIGGSSFVSGSGSGYGGYGYGAGYGGAGYGGYGSYPMGGTSQAGFGPAGLSQAMPAAQPGFSNSQVLGLSPGMPQTSNGTDPLLGAIHRSVRRSKRR